jgi:hypothetical protein
VIAIVILVGAFVLLAVLGGALVYARPQLVKALSGKPVLVDTPMADAPIEYRTQSGGFSVSFPCKPLETEQTEQVKEFTMKLHLIGCGNDNDGVYQAHWCKRVPGDSLPAKERARYVLDGSLGGMKGKASSFTQLSETEGTYEGLPFREAECDVVSEGKSFHGVVRIMVDSDRVYDLLVLTPPKSQRRASDFTSGFHLNRK